MSKKQRRLVSRIWFPVIALIMMTTTMVVAGADNRTQTAVTR